MQKTEPQELLYKCFFIKHSTICEISKSHFWIQEVVYIYFQIIRMTKWLVWLLLDKPQIYYGITAIVKCSTRECSYVLALKVLVVIIDAQWEGMGV